MSDSLSTPQTVALQAPLSMGFPRQEYWSGLLFPSLGHLLKGHKIILPKKKKKSESWIISNSTYPTMAITLETKQTVELYAKYCALLTKLIKLFFIPSKNRR